MAAPFLSVIFVNTFPMRLRLTGRVLGSLFESHPSLCKLKGGEPYYLLKSLLLPFLAAPHDQPAAMRGDVFRLSPLFSCSSPVFKDRITSYAYEIHWSLGKLHNGMFDSVDAILYYCMIRYYHPKIVLEIGTGNSAWIANDALQRNGFGKLVAIDPTPRTRLPRNCQHIRRKVQDVPLSLFRTLRGGDILFVDSSHSTEEAKYHSQFILPVLLENVIVHYHDIPFPFERYVGDPLVYGEANVLLEFLLKHPEEWAVIASSSYALLQEPALISQLVPLLNRFSHPPSSLWLEKWREKDTTRFEK